MNSGVGKGLQGIIAAFLLLVGLSVGVVVSSNDDGQGHKATTIEFKVDRSGAAGVQTGTVTVAAPVVASASSVLESDLRDETPAGAPPAQLEANEDKATEVKATLPAVPIAGATADVPGCVTKFVGNQSSRNGVRPIWFPLHYTVSVNRPGWSDVYAIAALFDRSASQASSHFIVDAEGHCLYIVPIERKAWTQAAGNSLSVSVEVIASGRETTYLPPAGLAKLRSVFHTVSARTGIPLRQGSVYPAVAGCVQHKDGGLAWGGHIDITPFSRSAVCRAISAGAKPTKKQLWVKHRVAIHNEYAKKCKHKYQRERRPATCARLRSDARKLDRLIARK